MTFRVQVEKGCKTLGIAKGEERVLRFESYADGDLVGLIVHGFPWGELWLTGHTSTLRPGLKRGDRLRMHNANLRIVVRVIEVTP